MNRMAGLLRLVLTAVLSLSVGLVLTPATSVSADFSPDPFDPATPGTTAVFGANFNGLAAGSVPAGWIAGSPRGWTVYTSGLTSPFGNGAPTGIIPVLDGAFLAVDNDNADTNRRQGTLTSPIVDLTGTTDPYLTFDVHSFFAAGSEGNQGFDTDKSYLRINVVNASTLAVLDQVFELGDTDINGADGWLPQTVRLADWAGQQIRLQLVYVDEGASSSNDQHDIALDNISVVDVPAPDGTDGITDLVSATYFLPISDADVTIAQTNVYSNEVCGSSGNNPGPQDTVTMLTSITVGGTSLDELGNPTSAVVLYDHVEDGFGPNNRRTQSTTEVWGDGDPSNGYAPGYPGDLLFPGDVIVLTTISDPGVASPLLLGAEIDSFDSTSGYTLDYDAGDRLTAASPLVITRAGWNDGSSTLLAGAVEVADTSSWSTVYEMPVGENLDAIFPEAYDYTGASILARTNGTVVTLPGGGTVTLDAGETYFVDGGINAGDVISSSGGPISVNLLTGNPCSTFEGRWFRIDPVRLYDHLYFSPVGITDGSNPPRGTAVALYNPGSSPITVSVWDEVGFDGSVTVPAGGTARYNLTQAGSGARFESNGGEPFYAVQNYDSDNSTRDWGFALLGQEQLSPVLQAGLALGVDPTSGNTTNVYSPIWVAAVWIGDGPAPAGGVDVCIDWNGDGGSQTVPGTTLQYDTLNTNGLSSDLDNLVLNTAAGAPSNDLTGTKVFVCNPSNTSDPNLAGWVLAGAWGQDSTGPGGSPSIDVGTTVFNVPSIDIDKALTLVEDDNGNGIVDVGDTVSYSIEVTNTSGVIVLADRLKVWDNLPAELAYVENSTYIFPELAPLSGGTSGTTGSPAALDPLHSFGQCVGVGNFNSTSLGAPVQQENCSGNLDQSITIRDVGSGQVELVFGHSNLCVGISGGSTSSNAAAVQSTCGATGTRFVRSAVSGGYRFQATHSGLCLDVSGAATTSGTPLIQWGCNGQNNQTFAWNGTVATTGGSTASTDPEQVPDDDTSTGATAFPLDDADGSNILFDDPNDEFTDTVDDGVWWNRELRGGESFVLTFEAEILAVPANNVIVNTAIVTDGRTIRSDQVGFEIPPTLTIGDRVWLDEDADGVQDAGEDGIAGVTVTLSYTLADGTPVTLTTTTDANGGYVFTDVPMLPAGDAYTISIAAPSGMDQTYDEDGAGDLTITLVADPLAANTANPLALQPGEEHMTADFGLNWVPADDTNDGTGLGAIGDRVWADVDGDGVQDPGEAGIEGVTVTLYADLDGDGVYDDVVATTTTDANGNYIFDDLEPGAYVVVVTPPAGTTQTGDPDDTLDNASDPIPLAPGDVYVNADFGYQPAPGGALDNTIGDTIWLDGDADGVIDPDEPGIAGVSVVLLDDTGAVVATTTTDENGQYLFEGVPSGDYQVWVNDAGNVLGELGLVSDPDGTLDARYDVTVTGGDTVLDADFGYAPPASDPGEGLIGDTVFIDADGDGIADPGEGIEGVRLELYDEFDRLVGVTYTNENGQYVFGDLPPTTDGTYTVVVDTGTLPAGLVPTVDPDGGDDSLASTPLAPGEQIYTMDFGYEPANAASLSGTIWEDSDADGVLQGDEPGRFEGVTVVLTQIVEQTIVVTDPDTLEPVEVIVPVEQVIATTTTDADGNYSFDDLAGGDYIVRVSDDTNVLGGYWHSDAPTPGADNQSQDDSGYAVTVPAGGTDTTADFGYYLEPGAVGDTVFEDINANGIQDAGEPGIEGALVALTITYPDGVTTTTMYTTTGPDGTYEFGNLLLDEDYNGDAATAGGAEPTYVVTVADLPAAYDGAVSTDDASPVPTDSTTIGGTAADDGDADDPAGEPAYPGQGITDGTNDFGYVLEASIGDRVWVDANGNGIQDAGEAGLAGVTVTLYGDTDGDGAVDDVVATVATDATGNYLFDGLVPGDYQVVFTAPTDYVFTAPDAGADDTIDSDANAAGESPIVTLTAGTSNTSVDAGLYVPVSIGDLVFDDANGNGTYDGAVTDPGIGGVTVELWQDTDGNGTLDAQVGDTVTDPTGFYSFDDLPPGSYGVIVDTTTLPAGTWTQTVDPDGTVDDQTTTAIVLASGQSNDAQDFGYFLPAVIGDYVWYDADGDGVQDAGEPGLPGVDVQLWADTNGDGIPDGAAPIAIDTTDDSGLYLFEDLPAGDYVVIVDTADLPAGFDGGDNTYDRDGNTDNQTPVELLAGQSQTDLDFGYFSGGTIGDTIFHDVDGDGVQDAGEPGIGGVTVELWTDDGSGGLGTLVETDVTSGSGGYLFTDLPADDYIVVVRTDTLPPLFGDVINSADPDQTSDRATPGNSESLVDLNDDSAFPAGVTDLDQDFGYFVPSSIGDRVFEDVNNNGVDDAGEPGIGGVTVTLTGDLDGDPATVETISTTTAPDGSYLFENLPPGDYVVSVDPSTLPDASTEGWVQTYERPAAGNTLDDSTDESLGVNEDDLTLDFGYFRPATIGDFVWSDDNANGVQDAGEAGVEGIEVILRDADGAEVASTFTAADGSYLFTDLVAGEYTVEFVIPNDDHVFTDPNVGPDDAIDSDAVPGATRYVASTDPFIVAPGEDIDTIDAGLVPTGALGDFVWNDTNGNGIQDSGEPGIEDATVTLYAAGSTTPITSTTTDAAGAYLFDGLEPGDYYVVVAPPTGDVWLVSPQNVGADDSVDSDIDTTGTSDVVSIGAGQTVDTLDAGFVEAGSIGDRVWRDLDGDGIQDSGEPGLGGITVELTGDVDGDGVIETITTTTDSNGAYSFDGLFPGDYTVEFTAPDGYVFSPQDIGADDTVDSDADATGTTGTIVLAAGEDITTVDAGLIQTGSIGDRVWYDADGDGIQDAGEAGVDGVEVTLTGDVDGDGVVDVVVTSTDAAGNYLFTGLVPGDYTVTFASTDGVDNYLFSPQNVGLNDAVDSDADPVTGEVPVVLAYGENDLSVDAGVLLPGTISGTVTEDIDGDGAGELPLPGVTVTLYLASDPATPIDTATTGPDGSYSFDGLYPGDYIVVETNPVDYVDVADTDTTDDGDPADENETVDNRVLVRLTTGETDDGNDFVDEIPADIELVKTAGTAADGVTYVATGVLPESYVYTFEITNTGVATLSNVTLTDPLPGLGPITCDGQANGSIVLAAGESITCTADYDLTQADIDAGGVENLAAVRGERPRGDIADPTDDVFDSDPADVTIPQEPALDIVKVTNGVDSNATPGELIAVGSPITWTYTVTNTGNTYLAGVTVDDDQLVADPVLIDDGDGDALLAVGETWVFEATGVATAGQYTNIGTATGNPVDANGDDLAGLTDPSADDPDHYFGVETSIVIEKTVALAGAGCPGVELVEGESGTAITYCFAVTNTGNVPLNDVVITDADLFGAGVELPVANTLGVDETVVVSSPATIDGDLVNTAAATGQPMDVVSGPTPTPIPADVLPKPTDDDSAEVNEIPTFTVTKTNDADGDGTFSDTEVQTITPDVEPFRVVVTNDGTDAFQLTDLTDAVGGVDRTFTDLSCTLTDAAGATSAFALGGLVPGGAFVTCTFSFPVDLTVDTEEIDTVTVTVVDPGDGEQYSDEDTSTVLQPNRGLISGVVYEDLGGTIGDQDPGDPGIADAVVTITPPADIDLGAGDGQPVVVPVADGVTDDLDGDGEIDPAGFYYVDDLLPGNYTITVESLPEPYQQFEDPDGTPDNTTVVVLPAGGEDTDNDFGYAQPSADIEKSTNGQDADEPTGPFVATGDDIVWTYAVTNTGIVSITDVTVVDAVTTPATGVAAPTPVYDSGDANDNDVLDPGETWIFTATGVAIDGQYANLAEVGGTWTDSTGAPQTETFDEDPSHYVGVRPEIDVQKTVTDGTTCPGDELVTGPNGTDVVYCFEITNTGNVPLSGVTLTDAVLGITLADTTYVSGVAPFAGVLDLDPGESSTFSYASTIEGDLVNTAVVSGTPVDVFTDPNDPQPFPDGLFDDPTDEDTAAVDETPTFTVVKSNDADGDGLYNDTEDAQAAVSVVPFRVTITNTGANPATFTSIVDEVDGVERAFTDLECVLASTGGLISTGGSIPAGDTVTCNFTAEVDLTEQASETDIITVVLSDDDGNDVPGEDDSTVEGAAVIDIAKTFVSADDSDGNGVYDVVYMITVGNTGTTSGVYDLTDEPQFDSDVSVVTGTADGVSNVAGGDPVPGAYAAPIWTLVTGEGLAPGETHTYTLTFVVDATGVVAEPSLIDPCLPNPGEPGVGLFNEAVLTVDGVDTPAEACGDLPIITIDKTFVSAVDPDGDGTFTVTYTVEVANVGTADTVYDLTDSPAPDTDIVITAGSATVTGVSPTPTIPAWTANPWTLADDRAIAAGDAHVYTLVFSADASDLFVDPSLLDECNPGDPTVETGLFNEATVTSPGGSASDDACGNPEIPQIDVDKAFVSATDADADGVYDVVYTLTVTNTGDGPGVYSLSDTPQIDDDLTVLGGSAAGEVLGGGALTVQPYGTPTWTLVTGRTIPAGATHVYTLTFQVDATGVVAEPSLLSTCNPDTPQAGEGLFNSATLTYDGIRIDDEACGDLPLLTLDKTFVSATDTDGDGTFTVVYTVEVTNAGTAATSYDLTDSPAPDTDITITAGSAAVTGITPVPTIGDWAGNPWTLAIGQPIGVGETHTYTLTFSADATDLFAEPSLFDPCDPTGPSAGEGLFNSATMTSEAGTVTAEACGDPGIPEISLTKTFVSASDVDDNGVFTVVFTIEAENTGTGSGVYDLVDTESFDTDLDVLSGAAVPSSDGLNTPPVPTALDTAAASWTIAVDQTIAAGETHTFTLTFEVDAATVIAQPSLFDPCSPAGPQPGTGFFNAAELTYDGVTRDAEACGDLPLLTIDKQGPTIENDLDADGEIDLGDTLGYTIVVSNAGAVPLTGVTVEDTIIQPQDITCVRADQSSFDHLAGDDLGVGETITCTGTYEVVETDVEAGEVVNVATADSNETPPVSDTETGVIPPAVTIDKVAAPVQNLGNGQYRITYSITVGNTGAAGTYSLDDELQYGGGITINAAGISNEVPGTIVTNAAWNGVDNVIVVSSASPVALAYGETHVYLVTVDATVDPAAAQPGDLLCPPPGSGENGGFANTATVSMDDDVVTDDACVPPPAPELTIAKQVTSGPTLNDDGTYTVQYQVRVSNASIGTGLYDLSDELTFGDGITVLDSSIVNTAPGSVSIVAGWNGTTQTLAVDDAVITALATHTYLVTVRADALALASSTAGDCVLDTDETGTGFLNVATLTVDGQDQTADDCVPVPPPGLSVTKFVTQDSPVSNGDGTYDVTYTVTVTNSEAGPGQYSLVDDLAFGEGVTVLSAGVTSTDVADDLSAWAGSGTIVDGVAITGLTAHDYVVVATVTLEPTMVATARDCVLDEGENGTGLLNTAELYVGGEPIDDADACVQTPAPAIIVTKNVVDGGFVLNADGTFSITYEVLVTNNGAAPGQYELDDELTFGDGITIESAVISSTTPDTLATSGTWNGVDDLDVTVAPVAIDGTDNTSDGVQQHVYTIVVTGDATALSSATAGDCTLQEGEDGTGYLNTATILVEGVESSDDACDPDPDPEIGIDKTLTAGPTLNADGTYSLEYQVVVSNTGGFGTYDLSDALAFGGGITPVDGSTSVTVVTPNDGSIEAGPGWVGVVWDGVTNTAITTGQPIVPGGSHVYTLSVDAALDPVGFDPIADGTCPPPNEGESGGFLNIATVTSGDTVISDDACGEVPEADLVLTKNIVSGPTDLGDGTYEIVYDIVVRNDGEGGDAYLLDDELRFGEGITILSAEVDNVVPGDIAVSDVWNGVGEVRVVTDQPIAGLDSHTYRVTAVVDAITVLTTDDAACSTDGSLSAGGFLNVATIASTSTDMSADDCDEVPLPDISIAKSVTGGPTERDDAPGVYDITYDIVVTNAGPGSGRYDLDDDLRFGAGVTVESASIVSTDVATDLSGWAGFGSVVVDEPIPSGTSHTYTVTVVARMAADTLAAARDCVVDEGEEGTGLWNVAAVSGPLVERQEADDCGELPDPAVTIAKSVTSGPTLVSGTQYDVTYSIVVTNSGLGLGQYDLADQFQYGDGTTIVSASITSADVDVSATAWNGTTVTSVIDGVEIAGTSAHTYTVTVRVDVAAGMTPAARDCITGEGEDGTGLFNRVTMTVPGTQVPAIDTACAELPDPAFDITKTVTSGPTLNADGTYSISYRVVVRNTGDGPGEYDLRDQPQFGPAISIVSATVSSGNAPLPAPQSWNPIAGVYLVTTDVALPAGGSDTYTMTFVTEIDPGVLDETVATCVGGHGSTESEFYNRADVLVDGEVADTDNACEPPPVPNLEIEKSVTPGSLTYRGDNTYDVVYTVTVRNTGNGPTTYTLTDEFAFAEGVEVLSVAVTGKPAAASLIPGFNGANRTQVASAPIPAKTTHTYTIAVQVRTTGVVDEDAFDCTLDPGEAGTGLLNRATVNPTDEACVEIPRYTDLELTKAVNQDTVEVGQEVTFTLYVTNVGPLDASNVTVRDLLPAGLVYVSQSGDGSYNPSTGIWTIGDLAVSNAATIDLVVRVTSATTITNIAQVWTSSLPDPDSTPANNVPSEDDQDTATVTGTPIVVQQPPQPPPPVTLPPTGGETRSPLTLASLLVVAGLGLLVVGARRRVRPGRV